MPRDALTCASLIAALLCGILLAGFFDPALGYAVMLITTIASARYLTRYWFGPTRQR